MPDEPLRPLPGPWRYTDRDGNTLEVQEGGALSDGEAPSNRFDITPREAPRG